MRVPVSWLREYAAVPIEQSGREIAEQLIRAGLEVETVDVMGAGTSGPLVVGRVREIEELAEFKKPIRFCRVEVGAEHGHPDTPGERGIICGAANFAEGDLVVVALPGSELPGGFAIGSRKTYGRISDGMICSERELQIGEDYDGIMVLPVGSAEVGAPAGPLIGLGEEVLDIAVTPDRGYALSIRGVAREAATAYGVDFRDPGTELAGLPAPSAGGEPHPCASEDPVGCDLFTLRTITGIDPAAQAPQWMKQRLVACGMRSVSLAVDITNYVMLETGQPLHAFDLDNLRGPVRARRAEPGEVLETLDHVERTLDPDDLVIADDRGAVGLAGTMGGTTTEVEPGSINIALEAAHFDSGAVARMSRRHKLSSEASRRFERGVDRNLAAFASARAAALLLELSGGTYVGMTAVESAHEAVSVDIAADLPARVSGMPIAADIAVARLRDVGCDAAIAGERLIVTPPSWRPDLTDPYDLVEEVLRLVGYDQIPSVLPAAPAGGGLTKVQRLTRRVGFVLAGMGLVEAPAYPFLGQADLDALAIPGDDRRRALVRLANPLSEEQPYLRTCLLPGLLGTLQRNLSRGAEGVALFETGPVFLGDVRTAEPLRPSVAARPGADELRALDALLPEQPTHVAAVLADDREPKGWWGDPRPATWADAVAIARRLASAINVEIVVDRGDEAPFHPGRCARLTVDGDVIGHAGELHPRVLEGLGLPARTVALEVDLGAMTAAAADIVAAPAVNTMPVAKEDVALIVDESVSAADVARALESGGGELLESVRLFDEFSGAQIGEGKRSLAFSLRLRAPDRTLSAEELTAARQAAVSAAEGAVGAVLRG